MSSILNPVTNAPFPLVKAYAAGALLAPAGCQVTVAAAGAAVTVNAPSPAVQGMTFAVLDADGSAGPGPAPTFGQPITIGGNGAQIDGQANVSITVANDAALFLFDAGQWRQLMPAWVVGASPVERIGALWQALRAGDVQKPIGLTLSPCDILRSQGGSSSLIAQTITVGMQFYVFQPGFKCTGVRTNTGVIPAGSTFTGTLWSPAGALLASSAPIVSTGLVQDLLLPFALGQDLAPPPDTLGYYTVGVCCSAGPNGASRIQTNINYGTEFGGIGAGVQAMVMGARVNFRTFCYVIATNARPINTVQEVYSVEPMLTFPA